MSGVRGLSKYGDGFILNVIHKGKKYGFIVLDIESAEILRKRIDKSLEDGTFEELKKELMKR